MIFGDRWTPKHLTIINQKTMLEECDYCKKTSKKILTQWYPLVVGCSYDGCEKVICHDCYNKLRTINQNNNNFDWHILTDNRMKKAIIFDDRINVQTQYYFCCSDHLMKYVKNNISIGIEQYKDTFKSPDANLADLLVVGSDLNENKYYKNHFNQTERRYYYVSGLFNYAELHKFTIDLLVQELKFEIALKYVDWLLRGAYSDGHVTMYRQFKENILLKKAEHLEKVGKYEEAAIIYEENKNYSKAKEMRDKLR